MKLKPRSHNVALGSPCKTLTSIGTISIAFWVRRGDATWKPVSCCRRVLSRELSSVFSYAI